MRLARARWLGLPLAAAIVLGLSGTAQADIVHNTVQSGGNDTIAPGATTSIGYWIEATSTGTTGDSGGCDATGSSAAIVKVQAVPGVTVTPSAATTAGLTFKGCGQTNAQTVTFGSSTAADYAIDVSISGGQSGTIFSNSADFTLHVKNKNTPPSVSVSGPTNGASYEKGSVPAAACNVTDAEDGNSTFPATLSAVSGSLSSYGLGSQTASCSYTDQGGVAAQPASVTYAIVDTTAPVLTVPADITKEATGTSGATASWTASATDAVDPAPSVSCTPGSGGTFPLGTTVIACTAKDAAGNTASKSFNVVVKDTTAPTLTLPADITTEATGPTGASATWTASATDIVDGTVPVTCTPASGSTFGLGGNPVNCTATDASKNTGAGGFTVTVQDTTKPKLTLPQDTTVEATGPDGAAFSYTAAANDLVDGAVNVTCQSPSGTTFGLGETTVSCSASDKAGNVASGTFTVSVVDTTPPVLTLPKNMTVEAAKQTGADVSFSVSASDTVDGNVVPVCDHANETYAIGTATVKCTATDAAGNAASGSFTITVQDTQPPVLTDVPGDQTLEATSAEGAPFSFIPPTATDLVDGPVAVSCNHPSNGSFGLGDTRVTCTATDTHHNSASTSFTVTVQDTTAPVLSLPDNQTLEATGPGGAPATWADVTASDAVDGSDPVSCSANSGDTFKLGVTTVACSSMDAHHNNAKDSFTITVQDTNAPDVTVPGNQTLEATSSAGAAATWTASARDTVDGDRQVTCSPASGTMFPLGATTVDCAASDLSGNTGHGGFVVTVQDTKAPALTLPADMSVEAAGANGASATWSASATDIVDGAVTPTCNTPSGTTLSLGAHTITCTATDKAGNSAEGSFTVTVVDTTVPTLQLPSNAILEATRPDGAVDNYTASATDLVDGPVTPACSPATGSIFPLGTTTVTCSATDSHGNTSTGSFTVTVQDTTAPTMNTLPNLTAFATSASGAPVTFTATATDAVDGTVNAVCTPKSGTTFAPGKTTVTCTATDGHGNSSGTASFTVTVSFDFSGFLAPVDGNKVLNGMKAGSTAPIKWSISNEKGGYIGDLSVVSTANSGVVSCTTGSTLDDLSSYTTGNTTLRYDSTANQYIYNWQSPKKAGTCYAVVIGFTDGSTHTALFQLK